MGKSTTEQVEKSKDKGLRLDVTDDQLFEFLNGDRTLKLLTRAVEIALDEEGKYRKESVQMLRDLLDRYFGKAKERKDVTSRGRALEKLIVEYGTDKD